MNALKQPVWLFDLDNTLHDASHAIFATIDRTMNDYVAHHLRVDETEANRLRLDYWRRYGATLLGLVRHHRIDPHHFLRATHAFADGPDLARLIRAERGLTRLFAHLPGRKVLVTNAPAHYANAVLRHIGLHRHFERRYAIEQMRIHGQFRPKPSRSMLRTLLARERIGAAQAILVEDSAENLKSARGLRIRTVLVRGRHAPGGNEIRAQPGRPRFRPTYVGLQVKSVMQLIRRQHSLR